MKILFDHQFPFCLAHGGFQILIERLKEGLEKNGVEVEFLRWWDEKQRADVIHFFGRPPEAHIAFAKGKEMRYGFMELLTGQGSRSRLALHLQGLLTKTLKRILPQTYKANFRWASYDLADVIFASTSWERKVMQILFQANPAKIHVLPNGVADDFFLTPTEEESRAQRIANAKWLICLATITERKRVLEMCNIAIAAQTPLWIIGRPYAEDTYFEQFKNVLEKSNGIIRWEGAIPEPQNLAPILKSSRGFVLLSSMETQSVAASAAAAAGCPLFLSDLPWARDSFGEQATYCKLGDSLDAAANHLKRFYENAPTSKIPPKQKTWQEIGKTLAEKYMMH